MVHVVAQVADPYGRDLSPEERRGRTPLAVGLFVEAEIQGRHVEAAVELPRAALRGGDTVWVVDEESAVRARPVEVLRVESDRVIVGGGLETADRVVVTPLRAAVDGMRVRLLDEDDGVASGGAGAVGEAAS